MERSFWQTLYDGNDTPFDLRGPSAPFIDWLDAEKPRPGRAVVPGCGRGHDVLELARRGWDALGIDFAPSAVRDATGNASRAGLIGARFLEADIFALGPEHDAAYDLLFEQTCYCAIEPHRRDEYARIAARLVKARGWLAFVVYPVDGRAGGPPFNIGVEEVPLRFASAFELVQIGAPRRASAPGRTGKELFALLRRKA
jgi:SAM-dependent methyltransferase